ncbi:MAG: choice-of-anchor D domain-containing protein [bacterium]|nr:choice-of-anchor D domain-containing protein [Candidatus Kapabacteria bacterium]
MSHSLRTARRRILLLAITIILCAGSRSPAQSVSTETMIAAGGTTYVVAFPDTTRNKIDDRYPNTRIEDKAFLMMYSDVDNVVSITGPGYSVTNRQLPARTFTVIEVMGSSPSSTKPIVDEHCRVNSSTFRVTAAEPIILYQYLVTAFGSEAWTALPIEAWGNEYYAAAHPGEILTDITVPQGKDGWRGPNRAAPAEILVIAAYNDTKVTIVPNGQVHNFCNPTSITMQAGQAYQVQSWVDTLTANGGGNQPDFGGSRIFSTKPVGVISGNTRAQLIASDSPLGQNTQRNMLIEWISPADHDGTQFVYLPTSDNRRPTGSPNEDLNGKRLQEIVRVYGTHEGSTGGSFIDNGFRVNYNDSIDQSKFAEFLHSTNMARVHTTDRPAQVFLATPSTVKAVRRASFNNADAIWGSSMVTLIPRERWGSFAPYYAPATPAGMEHYINVVTDTNHRDDVYLKSGARFQFIYRIGGTDLIWGTMSVQAGVDNWLEGRNGARFSGHVYGSLANGGDEEFFAQGSNRYYTEHLGVAYAYPLAAPNIVVADGDSLGTKLQYGCGSSFSELSIEIESLNENPSGLRSVYLEGAINSTIKSVSPNPITGAIKAVVVVRAIDSKRDASATVVILDKTGKTTRVPFVHRAEVIEITPTALNFGLITPGTPATRTVRVRNPQSTALTVRSIRTVLRNPAFTIVSPALPTTIFPNDSIEIVVTANPLEPDKEYIDTLQIELDCSTWKIAMRVETANPCVNVNDLDFGTMAIGESRTLPLMLCNEGRGVVTFNNSAGGEVIEWLLKTFSVLPSDIARVKGTSLGRGDCITINVTFTASDTGRFQTVARFWANTRRCKDTSRWTANVSIVAAATGETIATNALFASEPNPFGTSADIRYTLARAGRATLAVYNARGERVATLADGIHTAGEHRARFDAALLPSGIYHYRLSTDVWSETKTMVKR